MSWRIRSPKTLAHRWPLNGHADDLIRGQHGTLVNTPTWAVNQFDKQCIELDGDDAHVNVGDVVALNSVSAFTIAFWMNQDMLDQTDYVFEKRSATEARVSIVTVDDGQFYFIIANGANTFGIFDYSTIMSAHSWYHISVVYDGSQTGDANRLRAYVNGDPVTLAFMSPIPATTADLAGIDAFIGRSVTSFDGKLSDFRLFYEALTQDEINIIIHEPHPIY